MPTIRTIPATKSINARDTGRRTHIRRVAGYARVSTDHDEQLSSYKAQIDYYTHYIQSRSDWEFVQVYTDEGISGTTTTHREGFKQMVADALDGKIDLIVTKSVSRFARNTVDSLTTIRKLKKNHVECFFEKENIWTFDGKGELLITIMSSIAQEESRSISENVTWSKRKLAKAGKVSVAYGQFLGYDRGPNGEFVINEEQAETVRLIYSLFLQGIAPSSIAQKLTEQGIPTPGNKTTWNDGCVTRILQNEKYIGDALLQKKFTVDFLTHKLKDNNGEVPQYYVGEHHTPIISKDIYALVQSEFERRKGLIGRHNRERLLSGKVKCGHCGSWFGKKTWYAHTAGQKVLWQCNGKYDASHAPCTSGNVTEREIMSMFMIAVNRVLKSAPTILETQKLTYELLFDTSALERERDQMQVDLAVTRELMETMAAREEVESETLTAHEGEYQVLQQRLKKDSKRLQQVEKAIEDKVEKKQLATQYYDELQECKETITSFNADLWNALLDFITVYSPDDVRFHFCDGSIIKVDKPAIEKKLPTLTARQKKKIAEFRREGISYNKIAARMHLTQGQVRSFCLSRSSEPNQTSQQGESGYCKTCGKPLVHTPGYRKKIFCSDGCRQDWWNRFGQLKSGAERATYSVVCQHCGKTFIAYGKVRKYCSRKCYVDSRWNRSEK